MGWLIERGGGGEGGLKERERECTREGASEKTRDKDRESHLVPLFFLSRQVEGKIKGVKYGNCIS